MSGFGWCPWLVMGALLPGCGGISEAGPANDGVEGAEKGGEGVSSGLRVELVWTAPLSTYGLDSRAFLSVAPDETRVLLPPDSYLGFGHAELALADGALLTRVKAPLLARDREWSSDLVATSETFYGVTVVDQRTRAPRFVLPGPIAGSGMSADGRYVAALDCGARTLVRHEVATGEAVSVSLEALPEGCHGSSDRHVAPLVLVPGGNMALLGWTQPGTLVVVNFLARTVALRTLPAPGPDVRYPQPGFLALEPAPSGGRVAMTTLGSPLRVFELHDLDAAPLELPTSAHGAFDNCYCVRQTFSPVAWSADERYIAALDGDGRGIVRRSTDGAVLAELPGASTVGAAAEHGPSLLAFTPSGTGLVAVTYSNGVDGDQVAYYRLSE